MAQAAGTLQSDVSNNDRLSMTIFLAALFHGIIILGVTFTDFDSEENTAPTLDVIIVQSQKSSDPLEADYLAQISQDGGGNTDANVRPTDVFTAPTLSESPGIAPEQSILSVTKQKQRDKQQLLTQEKSDHSINTNDKRSKEENTVSPTPQTPEYKAEIARLAAELDKSIQEYAKRPKMKFLNSRTREHTAARYMRNWINRVERIGNLNYPDAAVRNKLSGTLIMDVVIDKRGRVLEYNLKRSSGYKVLDDAARRIIELASPFPVFPDKLKREADVIHITRSWVFESSNKLTSH